MISNIQRWGVLCLALMVSISYGAKTAPSAKSTEVLKWLSDAGDLLEAKYVGGEIPLEPDSSTWGGASSYDVPCVAQTTIAPKTPTKRMNLKVKALYNNKEVGFWLSWDDSTKNDLVAVTEAFQDAVAVEFPSKFGNPLPYIGMGNKGRPVNVWQWKATWQLDVDKGYHGVEKVHWRRVPGQIKVEFRAGEDAGSSLSQRKKSGPAENLLAEGFGTITAVDSQGLMGKGVWDGKRWSVVMKRALRSTRTGEPSFDGKLLPVAFAVWDGAMRERNGVKAITRWRYLKLEKKDVTPTQMKAVATNVLEGADPNKGKARIESLRCFQCHVIPGFSDAPTLAGPDLTSAGAIHRPEYLMESIKTPSAVIVPYPGYSGDTGESTMPQYDAQTLPAEDYKHIVAYLGSLQ